VDYVVILETERLVFRPFTPDDFDLLLELHSDPEVQRYLGGMFGAEGVQLRLDHYLRDRTFVGRAGVSWDADLGERELGYTFARPFWGQGLASEAARGVIDWMWTHTDAADIAAFAVLENLATRRVLEKVGMVFESERESHGDLCAFYRLQRPAQVAR